MKKSFVRTIALVLTFSLFFVTSIGMTTADDEYLSASIFTLDSGAPNKEINLSDKMLAKQAKSVSELSALLQSFNDIFASSVEDWDWAARWGEHWELLYPSWYGGMYINENQDPVINVTRLDKGILLYIWETTGNRDILIREVNYSWGELCQTQQSLWASFTSDSNLSQYIVGSGVDEYNNNIVFTLLGNDDTRNAAMSEARISTEDVEMYITNKFHAAAISTMQNIDSDMLVYLFTSDVAELASKKPGSKVGNTSTLLTAYGSLGYRARWTRSGQSTLDGFVTTGHVNSWNENNTMYSALNSGSSSVLGTLRKIWRPTSTPGQDDFSFIEVSSPSNIIANSTDSHTAYVSLAITGMNVRISGSATGYVEIGVVDSINTSNIDPLYGYNLINLIGIIGSNGFIKSGDSGGIVYNSSTKDVVGIVEATKSVNGVAYGYVESAVIIGNKNNIWPY